MPLGAASLNRIARAILVAILVGVLGALGATAPVLASARVPKVVVIVGPVGSMTAGFRAQGEAAAKAAEAGGAQVVRVYSPNATWPIVQRATEGASIVVYLGHGNGWPSPYRDTLYPPAQNGFGLNPVAGADDTAHQYFGEAFIERLRLAPNAVVLLHHLCYASGNSEPGLSEGTLADSILRVDNFASGFLRAGARAVVAEGHLGPAYYVRALLTSRLAIEQIWQRSPTAHGNELSAASVRSPGYTERLDPDRPDGGYFRSLVSAGLTAEAVRAGAAGSAGAIFVGPGQPSLADLGLTFGTPSLRSMPVAGSLSRLTLPISKAGLAGLPKATEVGVRWDPLLLDPAPTASADPGASPGASPTPSPGVSPTPSPTADPSPVPVIDASPAPTATPDPADDAPAVDLVVPEQQGSIVSLATVTRTSDGLALDVRYPSAPGLYRLVATLHTSAGVAYDAATQALLAPVLVRVSGPIAAAFGVASSLTAPASSSATIAVRVVNAGTGAWDVASSAPPAGLADELLSWLRTGRLPAHLVATWVSTAGAEVPQPVSVVLDPGVSAPGGSATMLIPLMAPTAPGDYLLLLDVVSPAHGTLSALGSQPAMVRVTVAPAATPGPATAPFPPGLRG